MPPSRLPLTQAVRSLLGTVTGLQVGLGTVPAITPAEEAAGKVAPSLPYLILYPLMGGGFAGPSYTDYEADATYPYQVTTIAENGEQVEFWADRVRRTLIGRTAAGVYLHALVVPGLVVMERRSAASAGGIDVAGSLFNVPEQYEIDVTAA